MFYVSNFEKQSLHTGPKYAFIWAKFRSGLQNVGPKFRPGSRILGTPKAGMTARLRMQKLPEIPSNTSDLGDLGRHLGPTWRQRATQGCQNGARNRSKIDAEIDAKINIEKVSKKMPKSTKNQSKYQSEREIAIFQKWFLEGGSEKT